MIWFIAGPLIAAAVIGLWCLGHSPYGYLRLSEFPVLFCCLLAGKSHRAELHRIMVARKRQGDADPREAMRALADAARMERGLFGEMSRHPGAPAMAASTGYASGGPVGPRCGCVNCGGSASEHVEVIPVMVAEHAKPVGYIPLPEPLSQYPGQHDPEGER